MSAVQIPSKDAEYRTWLNNFATVALANAAELDLTTGQTTNITALSTAFTNAYTASQAGKASLKGMISTKDNMRKASEELIRSVAKLINANDNISDQLKADLGINVLPTPVGPVAVPEDLVVHTFQSGVNALSWKRNGNAYGTTFLIEYQLPGSSTWTILTSATSVRYDHEGQVAGQQIAYRVSAKRGTIQSGPSNVAIAYFAGSETSVLSLHEAA